jgi:hypothetical protein
MDEIFVGQEPMHALVFLHLRGFQDQLEGIANADPGGLGPEIGEGEVVKTLAEAHASAVTIKGHARHQHQIDFPLLD